MVRTVIFDWNSTQKLPGSNRFKPVLAHDPLAEPEPEPG